MCIEVTGNQHQAGRQRFSTLLLQRKEPFEDIIVPSVGREIADSSEKVSLHSAGKDKDYAGKDYVLNCLNATWPPGSMERSGEHSAGTAALCAPESCVGLAPLCRSGCLPALALAAATGRWFCILSRKLPGPYGPAALRRLKAPLGSTTGP